MLTFIDSIYKHYLPVQCFSENVLSSFYFVKVKWIVAEYCLPNIHAKSNTETYIMVLHKWYPLLLLEQVKILPPWVFWQNRLIYYFGDKYYLTSTSVNSKNCSKPSYGMFTCTNATYLHTLAPGRTAETWKRPWEKRQERMRKEELEKMISFLTGHAQSL